MTEKIPQVVPDSERRVSIHEEMGAHIAAAEAKEQQVVQSKRLIKKIEMWRYDPLSEATRRTYMVGTGDPEITVLDAVPGQINVTYDDKLVMTVFYNPEIYELRVWHIPFEEPVIAVPNLVVPSDVHII